MVRYTMYLDDTGTATLKTPNPYRPVTCLCGVIFEDAYYDRYVRAAFSQFKNQFLGPGSAIVHRQEVQKRSGRFHSLRKPSKEQRFHRAFNDMLSKLEFKIIAVVVDVPALQKALKAGYNLAEFPTDDYVRVVALAIERFTRFLLDVEEQTGETPKGRIVAEQKGKKEDRLLRHFYSEGLLERGTRFYSPGLFRRVLEPGLEIYPKQADVYGLQIADWTAWPMAHIVESPAHDISGDERCVGIDEWQLYRSKIWLGKSPGKPGNVGLKTVPDSSIGRSLVGAPLEKPTALLL